MIFQEPMTSLDPLYTIGNQMMRTDHAASGPVAAVARARALDMLKLVKIPDAATPHGLPIRTKCRAASASA